MVKPKDCEVLDDIIKGKILLLGLRVELEWGQDSNLQKNSQISSRYLPGILGGISSK